MHALEGPTDDGAARSGSGETLADEDGEGAAAELFDAEDLRGLGAELADLDRSDLRVRHVVDRVGPVVHVERRSLSVVVCLIFLVEWVTVGPVPADSEVVGALGDLVGVDDLNCCLSVQARVEHDDRSVVEVHADGEVEVVGINHFLVLRVLAFPVGKQLFVRCVAERRGNRAPVRPQLERVQKLRHVAPGADRAVEDAGEEQVVDEDARERLQLGDRFQLFDVF